MDIQLLNNGAEPSFEEIRKFYKENFNTQLSPDEEFRFHSWADELGQKLGRDMLEDLEDYDLRGAFKDGAAAGENNNFTDRFKKPNHPTFSNESIYHGTPDVPRWGVRGGRVG